MINKDEVFERIYAEMKHKLISMCFIECKKMSKEMCIDDAEEIVQEAFLSFYQYIDDYDEKKASLKTWLYTIARNKIFAHIRDKKSLKRYVKSFSLNKIIDESTKSNFYKFLIDRKADVPIKYMENRDQIKYNFNELTPKERKCLVYRFRYNNKNQKDIAKKIPLSESRFYVNLCLARRKLGFENGWI